MAGLLGGFVAEEFGVEFQRLLLRACVDDPALCGLVRQFVEPGQLRFGDATARWGWTVIAAQEHPTLLALKEAARKLEASDPAQLGMRDVLERDVDWRESQYLRGRVTEWARVQVFRRAYNESAGAFNVGDVDEAARIFERVIAEGQKFRLEHADRSWFFTEMQDRQDRRFHREMGGRVFPFGIGPLDERLGGGTRAHDLATVTGFSSIGKSFLLGQVGFLGARLRMNVLDIRMEGSREKIEDRYESRFAGMMYSEVRRGDLSAEVLDRLQSEYRILRDKLVIRAWGDKPDSSRVTFGDLRQELRELRASRGWVPQLILVDLPDLLHQKGTDGTYEQQTESYRQMRALADLVEWPGHEGYAVVTATHAKSPDKNSGIEDTEYVLDESWTGNSFTKFQISDIFITISRSRQEEKDHKARVFLCKARDSERHLLVRVETDMARGAFSKLGTDEIVYRRPRGKGGAASP